jgi:hypothetical protein
MDSGPTDVYEARARLIQDEWFKSMTWEEQCNEIMCRIVCVLLIVLSMVPAWLLLL